MLGCVVVLTILSACFSDFIYMGVGDECTVRNANLIRLNFVLLTASSCKLGSQHKLVLNLIGLTSSEVPAIVAAEADGQGSHARYKRACTFCIGTLSLNVNIRTNKNLLESWEVQRNTARCGVLFLAVSAFSPERL